MPKKYCFIRRTNLFSSITIVQVYYFDQVAAVVSCSLDCRFFILWISSLLRAFQCTEEDEDRLPRICEPTKTSIEEQWEKNGCFELTSVEQETYEKYLFGTGKHTVYECNN